MINNINTASSDIIILGGTGLYFMSYLSGVRYVYGVQQMN